MFNGYITINRQMRVSEPQERWNDFRALAINEDIWQWNSEKVEGNTCVCVCVLESIDKGLVPKYDNGNRIGLIFSIQSHK